jgi:hypothetical protein
MTQSGSAATKNLTTDYADYTDMDRSECVDGISHCLPACVREVLWECEASSHRFSTKGPAPQKATRGRARTPKVPPLQDETQRTKFAQAAKIFIDSSTDLTDGESSSCFVFMFSWFSDFYRRGRRGRREGN